MFKISVGIYYLSLSENVLGLKISKLDKEYKQLYVSRPYFRHCFSDLAEKYKFQSFIKH